MKYIRTKDGRIYELANEKTITEFQVIDHLHNRAFFKDEILAQADTIPELCDEVVIVKTDNPKITKPFIVTEFGTEFIKENNRRGAIIRGAIWTNKGLIYVAKMNEKGELELI